MRRVPLRGVRAVPVCIVSPPRHGVKCVYSTGRPAAGVIDNRLIVAARLANGAAFTLVASRHRPGGIATDTTLVSGSVISTVADT